MMIKEQWKEFPLGYKTKFRYAVSNHGQLCSFTDDISKGQLLRGGTVEGYKIFRYTVYGGQSRIYKYILFHSLVATVFLPDKSDDQTFVLHLDYDKQNNRVDNLQWATQKEMIEHREKNPSVIRGHLRTVERKRQLGNGQKLTATKVQFIKKKLFDPNRKTRLKIIARQFGVSMMALQRIKTGENWGHIKI